VDDLDKSDVLKQLAHDVRNALNGVAVNLEVARSRAERGADVAQVAPFLEMAAQQLEAATRLHKRYTDVVSGVADEFPPLRIERASDADNDTAHIPETTPTHGS